MSWLERTAGRPQVTSVKLVELMDRVIRHPERVQTIDDNPELGAADTAVVEWIANRVAKLDKVIVKAISQRREAKTDIGRALNEQKRILGYGNFQSHFSETLALLISLRTAERYMKLAKAEEAQAKIDKLSFLNSASDEGAKDVKDATKQGKADRKGRIGLYKLPLRLSADDRKAVDALRQSPAWPDAEESIMVELRRLCTQHGVDTEMKQETEHEANSANT